MGRENFAFYGFQASIPDDWRVEINPKNTREKTDIAFHTPKGNRFFVSWGKLDDATKRFSSLKEHRDASVKKIRSGQVTKVSVSDSRDDIVNGHSAIFSRVTAEVNSGMFSKRVEEKDMWSAHFYCPQKSRYYVVYCLVRDPKEYENMSSTFADMAKSAVCH
ncbi:MAG: hypothetical protein ACRECH_06675 [Nitrososphaerales archaeon]